MMRSYIFTDRERSIVETFLRTGRRVEGFKMIAYRVRTFKRLAKDVELYLALKRRLAEPETAVPT